MAGLVIFLVGSLGIVILSRHALLNPTSHGFPRFFAFEAILGLVVLNASVWFVQPFRSNQLISWLILLISIFPAIAAIITLRRYGHPDPSINDSGRLSFEKTTRLVSRGPYRYIRHPMYTALLLLSWGVFLKQITILTVCLVGIATVMLYLTAILEERENQVHFGESYAKYMEQTKRFIPYVF